MSGNQEQEKTQETKDVDLTAAGRGVWLVKVFVTCRLNKRPFSLYFARVYLFVYLVSQCTWFRKINNSLETHKSIHLRFSNPAIIFFYSKNDFLYIYIIHLTKVS